MSHSKPVQRADAQEDDDEIVEDHLEVDKSVTGQNFTCVKKKKNLHFIITINVK